MASTGGCTSAWNPDNVVQRTVHGASPAPVRAFPCRFSRHLRRLSSGRIRSRAACLTVSCLRLGLPQQGHRCLPRGVSFASWQLFQCHARPPEDAQAARSNDRSRKDRTFHPLTPARRHASKGNRTALTRCCVLIARPGPCSGVGEGAVRPGPMKHFAGQAKRPQNIRPREVDNSLQVHGREDRQPRFRRRRHFPEPPPVFEVGDPLGLGEAQTLDALRVAAAGAPRRVQESRRRALEEIERRHASNELPSHPPRRRLFEEPAEVSPGIRQFGLPVSMSSTRSATTSTLPDRISSSGVRPSNSSLPRWSHRRKSSVPSTARSRATRSKECRRG